MKYIIFFIFFILSIEGLCQTVHNDSMEYGSTKLAKDDKVFLALKDTAQKHLQIFINNLKLHGHDYKHYRFLVKSDFVQKDNHEHMWSRVFYYKNGIFKGVFVDSAFTVKTIHMGDVVAIANNKIEDWSIYDTIDGKTIGEFSEKYLEEKLKKDNAKNKRKQ